MWIAWLTIAYADPFDDWVQRESSRIQVEPERVRKGAVDLDGDGKVERWVTLGCEAMLIADGDRWLWIEGSQAEWNHDWKGDAKGRPTFACRQFGSYVTTVALHEGAPEIASCPEIAHHGWFLEADATAGTRNGSVWVARGARSVPLGERSVRVERLDHGVRVTGLGPRFSVSPLEPGESSVEGPKMEVVISKGTAVVSGVPVTYVSPGSDGVVLFEGNSRIGVDGATIDVSAEPAKRLSWSAGTAAAPPGPSSSSRPDVPRLRYHHLPGLRTLADVQPDWDRLVVRVAGGTLAVEADSVHITAPAGQFLGWDGAWTALGEGPQRYEAWLDGKVIQTLPVPPSK